MAKNDFEMNTQEGRRSTFSEKIGTLLSVSIFLTGFFSLAGGYFFVQAVRTEMWREVGASSVASKALIFLCIFCVFISLVKIALDESFFSRTLTVCMRGIGAMMMAASFLFPRLSDYQSSGFEIFKFGKFVLFDGMFLMLGILFVLLSCLIRAGFELQSEIDEIL